MNKTKYTELQTAHDEYRRHIEQEHQNTLHAVVCTKEEEWKKTSAEKIARIEQDLIHVFTKERNELKLAMTKEINSFKQKEKEDRTQELRKVQDRLMELHHIQKEDTLTATNQVQHRLEHELEETKRQLDKQTTAHNVTLEQKKQVEHHLRTHSEEVQVRMAALKQELDTHEHQNTVLEGLRVELDSLKTAYTQAQEAQEASAASEFAASELACDVELQLEKSEQARRALRSTVKKVTRELEAIRSMGDKMLDSAHAWEKKEKGNVSLRLKYEKLASDYEVLKNQVHEFEFKDVLYPAAESPVVLVLKNGPN